MKTRRIFALLLALCMVFTALSFYGSSADASSASKIKNVIIMIGDGMGENHLKLARENGYDLFMDKEKNYDLRGQSRTRSASHVATDSAAGGTAIASGSRIINQTVGVYAADPFNIIRHPLSISEVAQSKGMKTGIVTTDDTNGATPASFSTHLLWRKMYDEITEQELQTKFDLFWGANVGVTKERAAENGWKLVTNRKELNALKPGTRSFGQFASYTWRYPFSGSDSQPSLTRMTEKAISLLNYNNKKGFVLMVEGAHIDKISHRHSEGIDYPSKVADAANAVKGFDKAVKTAVKFAREDKHTIVLVTADHETGWIFKDGGRYKYHSYEHTAANVPIFVFGCDDLFKSGRSVMNKEIPVLLARKLGWTKDEFPASAPGSWSNFTKLFGTAEAA